MKAMPFFLVETVELGGEPGVRRFSGRPGLVGDVRWVELTGTTDETVVVGVAVDLDEQLVAPICWKDLKEIQGGVGAPHYGAVGERSTVTVRVKGPVETVRGAVLVNERRRR